MASAAGKRLAAQKQGARKGADGSGPRNRNRADGTQETAQKPPPDEIAKDIPGAIQWCDEEGERLRVAFERYFLGVDRTPPESERIRWRRTVTRLMESKVQNTALRFRISQVRERMRTYERYWGRILKEIEEGTYSRHLFKLKIRAREDADAGAKLHVRNEAAVAEAAQQRAQASQGGPPPVPEFDDATEPGATPPPLPQPKPRQRPRATLSDDAVRRVYDTYMDARRRAGESVTNVSFDAFASSLRKQVPTILEQHKAKAVEFKISIRDGKAVLRVVPRE